MSSFAVMNSYIAGFLLILMPIAGMMLVFYSVVTLLKDVRGADRKKLRDRLREEDARKHANRIEQSIAKQANPDTNLARQLLARISLTKKIAKALLQADLNFSAESFLTKIFIIVIIILGIGFFLKFPYYIVLPLAFFAYYLPVFVIKFMANRRMAKLINQLPDVFELVSQALRAGHSLASGIQLVGKQLPEPSGMEFSRIFHEQNLGIKIEEALSNFADRTDQLDIRFFVTAVLIQRQTGGDLAEILDKIGEVIRDRIKIMGQVKALTAEGRMSGWVLSVLPFVVFLAAWAMNPVYAGVLLYEKEGQFMLGTAIFFQVVGMLMIKKIVNIKI
jgi:tight adherence protein B